MTIMTTEEVQELISNQPDEQIIKELQYIIQYEPELLQGYPLNRTLFHLLILLKKPHTLISLIVTPQLPHACPRIEFTAHTEKKSKKT